MKIYSFEELQNSNEGKAFSVADYLQYALNESRFTYDVIMCFIKLVSPTFVEIDGFYLIEEVGSVERFKYYRNQGMAEKDLEYWSNMTDLRNIFAELSFDEARSIAVVIADCWTKMLRIQSISSDKFFVVDDRDEDEIYVTRARSE